VLATVDRSCVRVKVHACGCTRLCHERATVERYYKAGGKLLRHWMWPKGDRSNKRVLWLNQGQISGHGNSRKALEGKLWTPSECRDELNSTSIGDVVLSQPGQSVLVVTDAPPRKIVRSISLQQSAACTRGMARAAKNHASCTLAGTHCDAVQVTRRA
jgi:hypothetical protein